MDDGGRCLLDVINDPLLLQSFLECGSDNFPKGHHNGDNSLSAATAGGTLLIGHHHHHHHHHDVVTSTSATTSPSTLLSLASFKPSLESMGFNCQVDKQSLMGHITVSSAVGTSVISPLPAVYPLSAASRFSPSPQQLYSIKSPSQGSSPAQSMPPPSPLQSPPAPKGGPQHPYHSQPTIIPLSMHQQQPARLSALSGHVVPTTSGVPSVVQIISPQPGPVVTRSAPTSSVRPIQPKQPQQILPKPPKSAHKSVVPNPIATSPRAAMGVSLNAPTGNPVVIGQPGQPGVFTGPQGTIVLNQFLPGVGHGPFVIQGNIGNMQGVQLTLRPTQPAHYTTSPTAAPQPTGVTAGGGPQNNATLIAALQAPTQHAAPTIIGQAKAASLPAHHTIVFPGGLTNLTSQGSVIHSPHPNQGILTAQRPNIFLAPRMIGNHALQLQQIQTPQGPITIALAPSHTLSLQQLAGLQGPQLTSVPGVVGQGVFSNVALTRHQPSPVPVPSHSPFAPAKPPVQQDHQQVHQPQVVVRSPAQKPATPSRPEPVAVQATVDNAKKSSSSAVTKPSLNLAELLKEHGIVPETTPPSSPVATSEAVATETEAAPSETRVEEVTTSCAERVELPSVVRQAASLQEHPTLLSRLNSAPAAEASPLVLGAMRSATPPDAHLLGIPLTIRSNNAFHLPPVTLSIASDLSCHPITTSSSPPQQQRLNHVIVGLQPLCNQQQPLANQSYVPTTASPVLVPNDPPPPSSLAASAGEFQSAQDVVKHQQTLLVQLRPPCQAPFGTTSRTVALTTGLQTCEKSTDNCKLNQELNKNRQGSACSSFINMVNRPPPLLHHLALDHSAVLRPEAGKPFASRGDACARLLRYHVYDSQAPTEEDLVKTDQLFEVVSQRLLERRQRMINKYRYLLLRESMKASPSSENVMLERMFIQEEIPSLKMYKKMLSEGREREGAPQAVVPVPPPEESECRVQSLKRDRTKSPGTGEEDYEDDSEPSSKKCVVIKGNNNPEESVPAFNHVHEHEDMVSKIRKELNISPIEQEEQPDFEAHSDFFDPPSSSCGSPFPKSGLRYDFDSEWSEAYMDADLFSSEEPDNGRTLRVSRPVKLNGEFLGSLDSGDEDSGGEVNVQVQTAIKSILDIDSSMDNHSYYADGKPPDSHFDESLNADNSLESDAALDEAVRSILL